MSVLNTLVQSEFEFFVSTLNPIYYSIYLRSTRFNFRLRMCVVINFRAKLKIAQLANFPLLSRQLTVCRDSCHAPNPGPTRLADPNRFPGRETQDWDSLPDFFFKTELVPVGMAHIL